jgi:hypothetical protein
MVRFQYCFVTRRTEEQMQYCQTSTMEINALAGLVANEKWEAKMNRLSGGGY